MSDVMSTLAKWADEGWDRMRMKMKQVVYHWLKLLCICVSVREEEEEEKFASVLNVLYAARGLINLMSRTEWMSEYARVWYFFYYWPSIDWQWVSDVSELNYTVIGTMSLFFLLTLYVYVYVCVSLCEFGVSGSFGLLDVLLS